MGGKTGRTNAQPGYEKNGIRDENQDTKLRNI